MLSKFDFDHLPSINFLFSLLDTFSAKGFHFSMIRVVSSLLYMYAKMDTEYATCIIEGPLVERYDDRGRRGICSLLVGVPLVSR